MNVVQLMAARAVPGRALVALARVTERTGDLGVSALEGELGVGVIEARLAPALLAVTAGAVAAELAGVGVVGGVTPRAVRRRVAAVRARLVAALAGDALVGAAQRVVRRIVREGARVESDDVGVASLVLGVADAALRRTHRWRPAVEAGLGANVRRDRLVVVAAEAERILLRSLEGGVALRAVGLEVRVRLRDRARHDEPLERLRPSGCRGEPETQRENCGDPQEPHSVQVDGDDVDRRREEEDCGEGSAKTDS